MAEAAAYQKVEHEEDATSEGEHEDAAWRHIDDHVRKMTALGWLRLLAELLLVVAVLGLASRVVLHSGNVQRGANEPRKQFGFVNRVFMNDTRFANEESLADPGKLRETLKEWLPMSSKGRGYVRVDVEEREGMDGPPYLLNPLMRPGKKEAYMVSGMHQLHCLSTIMTSYARLRKGEDESEMGYHIAHCFDYLRQGIICAGDSTLEGNNSATYPGVEIPWGTTHRCVNWDALREWADERTIWPFPPGIDIL